METSVIIAKVLTKSGANDIKISIWVPGKLVFLESLNCNFQTSMLIYTQRQLFVNCLVALPENSSVWVKNVCSVFTVQIQLTHCEYLHDGFLMRIDKL